MKTIKYFIIVLATGLLAWMMPMMYHIITDEASGNIFTYYSSLEKSFCTIDFDEVNERLIRKNMKTGKEYNEAEFDSILPLFYYRQLLSDGRMPDTIHGVAVTTKDINSKTFYFRVNPTDKNTPHIPLYTLFESMSGRVNLEMPGDLFRITNKIEFVDPENNQVKTGKSALFMRAFEKRNFHFPAKLVAGNPSTRKPYEEGYFITDSEDQMFHLKMVNGKPFLRKVTIPEGVKPVHIAVMEPSDRSFYAFFFDEEHKMYQIQTDAYKVVAIPTPEFDLNRDKMMIMANPLYWNINVMSKKGKKAFAMDVHTREIVDQVTIDHDTKEAGFFSDLFPVSLYFESPYTRFVKPMMYFGGVTVLFFNLFFVLLFVGIMRYRKQPLSFIPLVWVALTGVLGFIPCLVLSK
ncbi:DUF4857 domain-containing protein [Puteibacter caeruleilacunae]|nr:DUF4857 domain-containing protein [Puteibacter caeruleilacunae]